jgi:hypothetical protein
MKEGIEMNCLFSSDVSYPEMSMESEDPDGLGEKYIHVLSRHVLIIFKRSISVGNKSVELKRFFFLQNLRKEKEMVILCFFSICFFFKFPGFPFFLDLFFSIFLYFSLLQIANQIQKPMMVRGPDPLLEWALMVGK